MIRDIKHVYSRTFTQENLTFQNVTQNLNFILLLESFLCILNIYIKNHITLILSFEILISGVRYMF